MKASLIDRLNNSHKVNYVGQFNMKAQRRYITAVSMNLYRVILDYIQYMLLSITVAARFTAWVCGHSLAGIAGFEFRRGHVCLSVVSVVCCQVEVFASG